MFAVEICDTVVDVVESNARLSKSLADRFGHSFAPKGLFGFYGSLFSRETHS